MRSGSGAEASRIGGAWHCAALTRSGESWAGGLSTAGNTATRAGESETPCTEEGCTKGACITCMVLQQSWESCPCDEHGIESQHCIACCGVAMGPQSKA